jgi:hypothetical protein
MKIYLRVLTLAVLLSVAAVAAEIRVATLNCYLCFDPAVDHPGKIDDENRMTPEEYQSKITNLASLVKDSDFIGLEEMGGRDEVEALAAKTGFEWAFAQGKDTYTGENVAGLYRLPGWKVTVNGRVAALDKVLSKHLLVTAKKGSETVRFLVIHLLRPIGANEAKHQGQLSAIRTWADEVLRLEPASTIVVLGDTNDTKTVAGSSLLGVGREANELTGFAATHLDGHPYDRLIVLGVGSWAAAEIVRPPYPKRPNNDTKRVWTDHYLLTGRLALP